LRDEDRTESRQLQRSDLDIVRARRRRRDDDGREESKAVASFSSCLAFSPTANGRRSVVFLRVAHSKR
jgi:hypothetical protein